MARHKQPREIAELKGSIKENPQRYKNEVPKSAYPVGNAPDYFDAGEKSAWFEIVSYAPEGVITGSDRIMLEVVSSLVFQFRSDREGFAAAKLGQMIGILARLGMSPADRQKLGTGKSEPENPFDGF